MTEEGMRVTGESAEPVPEWVYAVGITDGGPEITRAKVAKWTAMKARLAEPGGPGFGGRILIPRADALRSPAEAVLRFSAGLDARRQHALGELAAVEALAQHLPRLRRAAGIAEQPSTGIAELEQAMEMGGPVKITPDGQVVAGSAPTTGLAGD